MSAPQSQGWAASGTRSTGADRQLRSTVQLPTALTQSAIHAETFQSTSATVGVVPFVDGTSLLWLCERRIPFDQPISSGQ